MPVVAATLEDLPALCDLLALLFAQESEFAPDTLKQMRGLEAILRDPAIGVILVLKKENRPVGMVSLLFTISTFLGARVALLEDLIVHPDHRGHGAGTVLVQAARQRALEEDCRRLTLLTDATNAGARRFYEKLGFTASTMTPYRMLL